MDQAPHPENLPLQHSTLPASSVVAITIATTWVWRFLGVQGSPLGYDSRNLLGMRLTHPGERIGDNLSTLPEGWG